VYDASLIYMAGQSRCKKFINNKNL